MSTTKKPQTTEEIQKMGKPKKEAVIWGDIGIDDEQQESNILGEKNPFEPDKVSEKDYDFSNNEPELFNQTDEIIIDERPKRQAFQQPQRQQYQQPQRMPQQIQQPQRMLPPQPPRVMQQRPMQQQETNILGEDEEINRLVQKFLLTKKQLALIKQRLAEYGVDMK